MAIDVSKIEKLSTSDLIKALNDKNKEFQTLQSKKNRSVAENLKLKTIENELRVINGEFIKRGI
ncbi:hypothetical protein [Spiroplasma eriocheiris]|uniref:Uncharacterized protein n=1 Tax=Spiroplasma eriocheiris TaxID=315358 RepID=A0A0H3XKI8_9MOLU|nr:hypothetical protein [Spiroplasma eriocheiris]AHF57472.1 hypothetical protein SPE_0343 [Spiroplasma eriocheiris CCTCC M 207170]AKM53929.1 hypothetical protein SERIO_v1c03470 [Spiroplasma eriocheiris]